MSLGVKYIKHQWYILNNEKLIHVGDLEAAEKLVEQKKVIIAGIEAKMDELEQEIKKLEE